MRRDGAAALRALVQLRRLPAMRRLARAQAHLRSFAFWNSHKSGTRKAGNQEKTTGWLFLHFQFVQRAPVRRLRFDSASQVSECVAWTFAVAFPIAVRISRQVQQKVLADQRRSDRLLSGPVSSVWTANAGTLISNEFLQARDATAIPPVASTRHWPKARLRDSEIEIIMERPGASDFFLV